jgi:hypothetical protein
VRFRRREANIHGVEGFQTEKLDDRLGTCGLQPRFDVRMNWTPSTNFRLQEASDTFGSFFLLQPKRSGKRLRCDCRAPGYSRAAAHIAHERVVRRSGRRCEHCERTTLSTQSLPPLARRPIFRGQGPLPSNWGPLKNDGRVRLAFKRVAVCARACIHGCPQWPR